LEIIALAVMVSPIILPLAGVWLLLWMFAQAGKDNERD
jgi:hypothetical protein